MTKNPPLDAVRNWLKSLMADKNLPDITSVARGARMPNTTLSRPYNTPDWPHRVSLATLRRVSRAFNYPMPAEWTGERLPAAQDKKMDLAVELAVAVCGDDKRRLAETIRLFYQILLDHEQRS